MAATFVLGGLIGPPMAHAADVPTAPKLVVLSGETATFRVKSSDLLELSNPTASATTTLLIANNGTTAQNLSINAFRSDGSSPAVTFGKVGSIAAGASVTVRVAMPVRPSDGADGYLVIEDSSTSDEAATVSFVVKRSLGFWVLLKPIWGGLVCSAAFFYFLTRRLSKRGATLGLVLNTGREWKFGESWASNIVAAGAIVATVAAAGGQLSELLPQLPVAQLVTVNLSLGFLVLLAPIAYQACMTGGKGTCGGLLFAGMFTFWAVIGQLVSVVLLLGRSGPGAWIRLALNIALVSALSLIGVYVWRSVTGLVLDAMTPGAAARTTAIL